MVDTDMTPAGDAGSGTPEPVGTRLKQAREAAGGRPVIAARDLMALEVGVGGRVAVTDDALPEEEEEEGEGGAGETPLACD